MTKPFLVDAVALTAIRQVSSIVAVQGHEPPKDPTRPEGEYKSRDSNVCIFTSIEASIDKDFKKYLYMSM